MQLTLRKLAPALVVMTLALAGCKTAPTKSGAAEMCIRDRIAIGAVAGVLLSVGVTAVAQRGSPLPLDELRQLSNVFAAIKNNYVESVDDKTLIDNAISGMVSNLDPHSAYLDADAFREMQTATQGEFGGLGIEVGAEDGFVKVISPIEDTPAARAGVMAGDLIIKIDDTPTKGMSLNDAVKLMRGAPKSPITLTVSYTHLDVYKRQAQGSRPGLDGRIGGDCTQAVAYRLWRLAHRPSLRPREVEP